MFNMLSRLCGARGSPENPFAFIVIGDVTNGRGIRPWKVWKFCIISYMNYTLKINGVIIKINFEKAYDKMKG